LIGGANVKKEVIAVRKAISPLEVGTVKERVKYDGFIERINVRFYAGQESELKVMPLVMHKGGKTETFFTYPEGTEPTLSGEDDRFEYPLSIDIEYDDEIQIRYENRSSLYEYTLVVDVIVSYYSEPSAR
jgi:hypothetical protein